MIMSVPAHMTLKCKIQWLITVNLYAHVLKQRSTSKSMTIFYTVTYDPQHAVKSLWNVKMYTAIVF
jgi:hypothetical protein